jgi:hypothetical protein
VGAYEYCGEYQGLDDKNNNTESIACNAGGVFLKKTVEKYPSWLSPMNCKIPCQELRNQRFN